MKSVLFWFPSSEVPLHSELVEYFLHYFGYIVLQNEDKAFFAYAFSVLKRIRIVMLVLVTTNSITTVLLIHWFDAV